MGIIRFVGFVAVGILAFVFLFVVATVAAFVYLPWWQALLASFAAMWLLLLAARIALKQLAGKTFGKVRKTIEHALEDRGKVLRGARVEVYSVTRVDLPPLVRNPREFDADQSTEDGDHVEDWEDVDGPPDCYRIEITITPVTGDGPAEPWEPNYLCVIEKNAPRLPGAASYLEQVETAKEGQGDNDSLKTCYGPQRLRALVRVPAAAREMKMYYFFELIGHISLPASQ